MRNSLERIWWNQEAKLRSLYEPVLAFASLFYRFGLGLDQWNQGRNPKRLPRPVLSVGNLTVGGTGKTPIAIWLADQAIEKGKKPCILTRGYGSKGKGSRKVDPGSGAWREYGDEPLLMAKRLPRCAVYVGGDRYESGQFALGLEKEIDLFILDDGFQHRRLARDFDLALVDGERGFGNGKLLPWGPLREPVEALDRADLVGRVWRREPDTSSRDSAASPKRMDFQIGPVGWRFLGSEEIHPLATLPKDRQVRLLSGIGSPQGFEATIAACGLSSRGHSIYPDHHPFSDAEVQFEVEKAAKNSEILVTTAKDGIRLETCGFLWTEGNRPLILEVSLIPGDGADYLKNVLNRWIG